jgi:hypothetical protein
MVTPPAAALIAVAAAAWGDLQLDAAVATGARTRTTLASGAPTTTAAEATVEPRVGAALAGPDLGVAVGYRPILRAPDLLTRDHFDVLHAADVRAQLRLDPIWQLTALAAGARGRTDLLSESRRAPADIETITTRQVVLYRSTSADLRLEGAPDPRTRIAASAGWFAGGGEDAASRALIPVERRVRGEGMLSWNATRRDRLVGRVDATGVEILDRKTAIAGITGTWRRQLTPQVEARMGGGAIGAVARDPAGADRRELFPSAELGIANADPRRALTEEFALRLGATIDRATGELAPQLEATATAGWAFARRWTLSGRGGATRSWLPSGDVSRVSIATHLGWVALEDVTLGGGVYADWQRTATPGVPSFYEGGVFVSASAAAGTGGAGRIGGAR